MSKSICFISGGLAGGGQERALTNLANEFATRGHQISIICLFKTEVFFEINSEIKIIWPKEDRDKSNKFIYALKLIPYIRKNIKQINPDSVVSFGDWFNSYSILATRFLKKPIYITNRMGPNLHLGKFLEFFNKLTYKSATAMIVQTARAKEIMKAKYMLQNIHIIPNAVKPINIENRFPEKSIITVGRLSKEKGHKDLIEAFSKIKDKSWRLDIVGDGIEKENLEKLVSNLGIKDQVFFHGHKKDFKTILAKASIFVLPSYYEGFPNSLVEAMSVPLACIASDCVAGPSEIIKHNENGFLYETGNVNSLTSLLDDLINNPSKIDAIEKKAFQVIHQFNFDLIATKFLLTITNQDENSTNK